ncbi:MAG: hypothetical protein LLF98_06555 [Clostridium sp.]|uniref:hypothetical protein n=1 Tax=Clostridium sp. TaxID=1506 RepID=UPI0025BD3AFF|nr:hypothetical protein [Clostridium sp.]MCE5220922.1 hypothetical protein [Clostridium sp.]
MKFEKSIIVLINGVTFGNFFKYNRNERIDNYYNHHEIVGELLDIIKEADLDIINCAKYHHKKQVEKNIYLKILIII